MIDQDPRYLGEVAAASAGSIEGVLVNDFRYVWQSTSDDADKSD